jgi:uncharacterized protein YciI
MQFMVIAFDGTDDEAATRRMAVREDHLKSAKELYGNGALLYAAGILDDDGNLVGSMMVCDFPSQEDLEERWLKNEPYITGGVWKEIAIKRVQVAPFLSDA